MEILTGKTQEKDWLELLIEKQYKFYRPPQEPELGSDSILTGPKV